MNYSNVYECTVNKYELLLKEKKRVQNIDTLQLNIERLI